MKVSFLLYLRLYFLKICYYVLNILSDLPRINKIFIRQKVYIGISIISLSLLIATACNTQSQKRINESKSKDSVTGSFVKDTVIVGDTINRNNELCYKAMSDQDLLGDTITFVEKMPEFVGGLDSMVKFLNKNLRYPPEFDDACISGRVIISFVINRNGEVINPYIIRSLDKLFDAEAIRVVKLMPNWIPGKQDGKPVNARISIPINFKLSDK